MIMMIHINNNDNNDNDNNNNDDDDIKDNNSNNDKNKIYNDGDDNNDYDNNFMRITQSKIRTLIFGYLATGMKIVLKGAVSLMVSELWNLCYSQTCIKCFRSGLF